MSTIFTCQKLSGPYGYGYKLSANFCSVAKGYLRLVIRREISGPNVGSHWITPRQTQANTII